MMMVLLEEEVLDVDGYFRVYLWSCTKMMLKIVN